MGGLVFEFNHRHDLKADGGIAEDPPSAAHDMALCQ